MREGKPPAKKQGDPFLRLTGIQLVCAALALLLAFGAYKLNEPLFQQLREEFARLMAADYDMGNFRFFDFGSADEKRGGEASDAGPDETSAPSSFSADAQTDAAGGADLTAAEAQRELSFAFYEAGSEVVLPVNGHETSGFGARVHPIYGTEGFHSGKDIAAPEGTPVHAAMDGEVLDVGVGSQSGNYVKLRHADGIETLYCHLQRVNVEAGVRVRCGDVIGFVGETGLATGPHLHFEVRIDGVKRDPDFLLEGAAVVS